jgi:hypothetical protein
VTAEVECRRALRQLEKNASLLGFGRAVLASILVAQGRAAEALLASQAAVEMLGEGVEDGETFIRLVRAQTLEAVGDLDAARDAAADAEKRLMGRADRIQDAALRESFLTRVPESVRTRAIAARFVAG